MKKNKLYTLTRWNGSLLEPQKRHLFEGGGPVNYGQSLSDMTRGIGPLYPNSNPTPTVFTGFTPKAQQALYDNYAGMFRGSGYTGKGAATSEGVEDAKQATNNALGAALLNVVGTYGGKAISGNLNSKAGNTISTIGTTVGGAVSAVNPVVGGVISAGSQLIGGLTNRAFGSSFKEGNIANVKNNIATTRAGGKALSGANTSEDLLSLAGDLNMGFDFKNSYIGKDGWFSSKAKRKAKQLRREQEAARNYALQGLVTGAQGVDAVLDDQVMGNFAAFGGPIDTSPNMGGAALDYGLAMDYLTMRNQQNKAKNKIGGISPAINSFGLGGHTDFPLFALGGDLQTHGADWGTGLTRIDAGGQHETNPNEGVQVGVDQDNVPNLVEEGETIYNDYVYSTRILADATTLQKFHLPKKAQLSFADISKKLEKEAAERPNDPISKRGLEASMSDLAEQQERQKAEMEAQRAKEAFEALSPEEQAAVIAQAAQQEQSAQQQSVMEQQAAMQQATMAQQQADGMGADLGIESQGTVNAEGGKLFKKGGYLWDKFWEPVNEHSKRKGNTDTKYAIDESYDGNVKELEDSDAYKAFTDYILNDATDEERMNYFKWIDANTGRKNKYITNGKLADNWQDMYKTARTDGLYGIQHYTPEFDSSLETPVPVEKTATVAPSGKVFHAMDGDAYDGYIEGELDPNRVGGEVRREVLPNGDTVIYHAPVITITQEQLESGQDTGNKPPVYRAEWPRYAGLFGPAVGLGMMAAGIGRPDTASIDAAIEGAGDVRFAKYKPLGNYLTYRPLDIWYEQNRQNANARAAERGILNSGANQGARMAGLLASGYNDQIASGNLFRQAQEYNDAQRERVASFNRGTDQFNSEQYGATSRFNAGAWNDANRAARQLRLQAASRKAGMDAGWYNSLYGNVSGLFKGLSDLGTENYRMNRISEMAADDLFGHLGESYTGRRVRSQKTDNNKNKKKRGLTFNG